MNRREFKFPYLFLALIAVVVIASSIFVGFNFKNNIYESQEVNAQNVATSNDIKIGYESNGDSLVDGSVPSGYSSSYTAWNPGTGNNAGYLSGSTNYKLTSDITLNFNSRTSATYSGTLDGCGKTITIATADENYSKDRSNITAGYLTGYLTGTIKNCTIVFDECMYHQTSKATKGTCFFGGIAGELSGRLENVKIVFRNNVGDWVFNVQYWDTAFYWGFVCGKLNNGTLTNVTIDVQKDMTYKPTKASGWGGTNNYTILGLVTGKVEGTSYINNITMEGAGKLIETQKGDNTATRIGIFCGKLSGNLYIDGWDVGGYTGGYSASNYYGIIAGEYEGSPTLSINNVLSKTGCYLENPPTTYVIGTSQNYATINKKMYTIDSAKIGFSHSDPSYVWIGDKSNCSFNITNNTASGNYVESVTINGSVINTDKIAKDGADRVVIPMFPKSSINGSITAYTKGNYVAANCNITGVSSISYSSGHVASGSDCTTTYNGRTLTVSNMSITEMNSSNYPTSDTYPTSLFIDSNHTAFVDKNGNQVKDVNCDANGDAIAYTLYANDRANYPSTSSNYVVCAKYSINIKINKANGTLLTLSDAVPAKTKTYVFTGNDFGIDLQQSELSISNGMLDSSDTWENESSVFNITYCDVSNGDFISSEDPFKIKDVKDSPKFIYYKVELRNYTSSKVYYRQVIINPADVLMDITIANGLHYEYTGTAIYENSSFTTVGVRYINDLLKACQTQPGTKLEFVELMQNGEINYSLSATSVKNVGDYTLTISKGISSGVANFTLNTTYTIPITIDKATSYLAFNTIKGVSKTFVTSGSVSENKYYDFTSETINGATSTIASDDQVIWTLFNGYDWSPEASKTNPNSYTTQITPTKTITKDGAAFSGSTIKDVGEYVTVYTYAGNGNINSSTYTYTYSILQNTFNISWNGGTRTYNAQNVDFLSLTTVSIAHNELSNIRSIVVNSTNKNIRITLAKEAAVDIPLNIEIKYTDLVNAYSDASKNEINEVGSYSVTIGITSTVNYTNTSKNAIYKINKTNLKVLFNDTKELYDSIIDYKNNNYDFIYVKGTEYTTTHLSAFEDEYASYFTKIIFANNTYSTNSANYYLNITTSAVAGTVSSNVLTYTWKDTATWEMKNNYSLDVRVSTTGQGYNDGFGSYCESAYNKTNYNGLDRQVRVIVVNETTYTATAYNESGGANDDYGYFNNSGASGGDCNVIRFINGHYYDSGVAANTKLILGMDKLWYDRPLTGSRILASYKTIDGNNKNWLVKLRAAGDSCESVTNESNGVSDPGKSSDVGSSTAETTKGLSHTEYPGYLTINGVEYYGSGVICAINYGTIKNIKLSFWENRDSSADAWCINYLGNNNASSSMGLYCGINLGIISNNTLTVDRLITFNSRSGLGNNFAAGQFAGINTGKISNNTIDTPYTIRDTKSGINENRDYYTFFKVNGSMNNGYYGLGAGLNTSTGTISNMTYSSYNKTDIDVTANNVYAGGFVGYNEGSISDITFNLYQATKDMGYIGRYGGSDGNHKGSQQTYRTREFYVSASGNVYGGGIVGYNKYGNVYSCTFNNSASLDARAYFTAKSTTANKVSIAGGIVGYNEGRSDDHSGIIQDCTETNYGFIHVGNNESALNAYAAGGIVGVTSGGYISNCYAANYGQIWGYTSANNTNNYYLGILLGVGCETGTIDASHRMTFNGTEIKVGKLLNCQSFNFSTSTGSIGANYGYWGYVAGIYNTILTGSDNSAPSGTYDYVHQYGNIIWYTNSVPDGYTKSLFGGIASILGNNGGQSSTNVYITGIAGVGIGDCGDNSVGAKMLKGVSLDSTNGLVKLDYLAPTKISNSFKGMDAYIEAVDETGELIKQPVHINGSIKATNNVSNDGVFSVSSQYANAIIKDTTIEASIARVYVRLYVDITTEAQYRSFMGDEKTATTSSSNTGVDGSRGSGKFDINYFCAGYGSITQNFIVNGNQVTNSGNNNIGTNITLSSRKTLRGRSFDYTSNSGNAFADGGFYSTIYYIWGQTLATAYYSQVEVSNGEQTSTINSLGNVVGINNGTIEWMKIIINPQYNNNSSAHQTIKVADGTKTAFGGICGVNKGTIYRCEVQIQCVYGAEADNATGSTVLAVGGICGFNDGGDLINNKVWLDQSTGNNYNYTGQFKIESKNYSESATSIASIGGIAGIMNGGSLQGTNVYGKGSIITTGLFTEAYVGGVAGYMPLVDGISFNGFRLNKLTAFGGQNHDINVAITGGVTCWNSLNGGSGTISGRTVNSITEAESDEMYNKILNANVTALCLGDVDAFQMSGRYENSLYGYVSDYSKDQSYAQDRTKMRMTQATNRLIIQDGSEYARSLSVLATNVKNNSSDNGYTTQNISFTVNWPSNIANGVVQEDTSKRDNVTAGAGVTNSTVLFSNVRRASNTKGLTILVNISYSVNISGESINYNNASALYDSPFINFISGRGSNSLYSGATTGNLKGEITYDKKATSSLEMTKRKTLNGEDHVISTTWANDDASEIIGLTDDAGMAEKSYGGNDVRKVGEYSKWYEGVNGSTVTKVYGVADIFSINRGTINDIKILVSNSGKVHRFKGMQSYGTGDVNTAYGVLCGVNIGTINNCEVNINKNTEFYNNDSNGSIFISPCVGMNKGTISKTKVNIYSGNNFLISGSANSITIGGLAALNGAHGSIVDSQININGTIERTCRAKARLDSGVVFGGITGINDGGAINGVEVSGTGTVYVSDRTHDISGANNTDTITDTEFRDDAYYIYFALGVGISNNEMSDKEYLGHAVQSCLDASGNNMVKNILLDYSGNLFYTTLNYYMLGIAFAKAADTTAKTSTNAPYENIYMTNSFTAYSDLVKEGGCSVKSVYSGFVSGLDIPFMGHVDTISTTDTSFVKGGRIDANANYTANLGSNGNLVITVQDSIVSSLTKADVELLPQREVIESKKSTDTTYLNADLGNTTKTVTIYNPMMQLMTNNVNSMMQIYLEFHFPYVNINDAYQLLQFTLFGSGATIADIKTNYLEVYKDEIAKLIGWNEKKFTTNNRYEVAWAGASDLANIIAAGYEDQYIEYTLNGSTYYLLVEKFYNAESDESTIYANARIGVLNNDIVLDEYAFNNGNRTEKIDLGWGETRFHELAADKSISGEYEVVKNVTKNHSITIVASTKKTMAVSLFDVQHTPSVDQAAFIMGGFIGINRGVIRNIDFIFRENTQLSITGDNYAALDMRQSAYAGLVCGYSTGTIDGCTLTMGDNSQVYMYKYRNVNSLDYGDVNNSKYCTNTLGGFVGLLGKGGIISNSTITMGENAILALNSKGSYTWIAGNQGSVFCYVGGFAGMMLDRSEMYNIKIEGAASSLFLAAGSTDCNGEFNCFYAAAGGVVGCNSNKTDTWNPKGLGTGTIDGVIFNWKGASLTTLWYNGGWFGSHVGGNRHKMTVTYYGGAALGVADSGTAKNLYYTFDISTFAKDFTKDLSAGNDGNANNFDEDTYAFIHNPTMSWNLADTYYDSITYYTSNGNGVYTAVPDLTREQFKTNTYYTTRTYGVNLNHSGESIIDSTNQYAVCMSDIVEGNGTGIIETKTLRVFEMTDNSVSNTGITHDGTKSVNGTFETYRGLTTFNANGYTEMTTLGDVLSWQSKKKDSNILCSFTADADNPASIMWEIDIFGASMTENKIINSANTVTKIPVYRFATSIVEAQEYKQVSYEITRGNGNGMKLYYCTGNAASLSPDKNYYTNERTAEKTVYYPLKAVMYDGYTDASKIAVSIYDYAGNPIESLSGVALQSLLTTATNGGYIEQSIDVNDAPEDVTELTAIGSYKLKYIVKTNGENDNAYVSTEYRTAFFPSSGLGADADGTIDTYTINIVIAPISIDITEIYKVYDGTTDMYHNYGSGYNNSVISANIREDFTYCANGINPSVTYRDGNLELSTNTSTKIKLAGSYDSPEEGDRTVTLRMGGTFTYNLYRYSEQNNRWITQNITVNYLRDNSGTTTTYFSLNELCTLSGRTAEESGSNSETFKNSVDLTNGYAMSTNAEIGRTVKIIKAGQPNIIANLPIYELTYTGSNISFAPNIDEYITIIDGFGKEWTVAQLGNEVEIAIANSTIKDVSTNAYEVAVTISYVGNNMLTATSEYTISVFVLPAQLEITKVIKEYDGTTETNTAVFAVDGLLGSDKNEGLSGVYADANVGSAKNVNITTTDITINSHAFITVLQNYYLINKTINKGVITPALATIVNAYKQYDGTTDLLSSSILATGLNNEVISDTITASFVSKDVGTSKLSVELKDFMYQDENGATRHSYLLETGSNYCLNSTSTTYITTENIAYILPAPIVISKVVKEYDGTTALGTFTMEGIITGEVIDSFDGEYSSANVVYNNQKYNDVYLNSESFAYITNNGHSTTTGTAYRLVSENHPSNYMLETDGLNVIYSNGRYELSGNGVIIPKLVTLSAVKKYYDGTNAFDSSTFDISGDAYAELIIDGSPVRFVFVKGTMSGKNATNGENLYNVTVDYREFIYNGERYVWIYHDYNNADNNNYCLASATINGVGDILSVTLSSTNNTSSSSNGSFYDFRFRNAQGTEIKITSGADYNYGQTYGSENFKASIKWNNAVLTLQYTSGSLNVDLGGEKLTFTLDRTVTNAGTYQFRLTMLSSSNNNFNFNGATFNFTIRKKSIAANNVKVVIDSATKVYDGTSDITTVTIPELTAIRIESSGVSGNEVISAPVTNGVWTSKTYAAATLVGNTGDCINVGSYNVSIGVNFTSLQTSNYVFSGLVTQVYTTTNYNVLTPYTITPYELSVTGNFEKDFDGTNGAIAVNGLNGEIIYVSYSNIGTLPGLYENVATTLTVEDIDCTDAENENSTIDNYTIEENSIITLSIAKAKIVSERIYASQNSGINYFNNIIAISNIKGFDMLLEANEDLTTANINEFITSGMSCSAIDQIKIAFAKLIMINVNDSPAWNELKIDQINSINVIKDQDGVCAVELVITIANNYDSTTATNRIGAVMVDKSLTAKNAASNNEYGSNISVSSSELAEGQFNGTYSQTGTAIATVEQLLAVLNGNGTGYLTNNIYGFDNTADSAKSFSGTIYGNGYTIVLSGSLNGTSGNAGYFVATNSGTIQDVCFKFMSTTMIKKEVTASIGLVVGSNSGTIKNCSIEIVNEVNLEEGSAISEFAGLAISNTGTIENVAVVYSTNIISAGFDGIVKNSTQNMNYIAVRNNKLANITSINGNTVGSTLTTVQYMIDAIDVAHTNGIIPTTMYGTDNTSISMFSDTYTNGYIDYYFTAVGKYTTSTAKHNEYEGVSSTNSSYYYGYDASKTGVRIAIETIAPYNRFIWEAYEANYTEYGVSLNRAVALFDLTTVLSDNSSTANCEQDTSITFITSTTKDGADIWVTIFNPAIGIIAEAVISNGVQTVKNCEYTGSNVEASFEVTINGEVKNYIISGKDVGVYTEYFEEGTGTAISTYDSATRTARVISGGAIGDAPIMLIISPKVLNIDATLTKQYDSTVIAETALDITNNGKDDIYSIGEYSASAVGDGYSVAYGSYTRPVAGQLVGGNYNFLTCHLSGKDQETEKAIYTVSYATVNGNNLTSATNITSIGSQNFAELARTYNQLVTLDYLVSLENAGCIINYVGTNGITSTQDLTSVYVYDLVFGHTVNNNQVTYTSGINYAITLFNVPTVRGGESILNNNYKWLVTGNQFTGTTLVKTGATTARSVVNYEVSSNGGEITQRTVNAAYSNLQQSYRGTLEAITITIEDVSTLENIPYSLTSAMYTDLIAAINEELKNADFDADVLGATVARDDSLITGNVTDGYTAVNQAYAEVALVAMEGSYSVTTNLAVVITSGATLVLRYFDMIEVTENEETENKFVIDSLEALLKIDSLECVDDTKPNDYQELDYIVTNNINAKSALVTTFENEFNGTIDGNNKTISGLVLVGTDKASLFNKVNEGAYIKNLSIINTIVIVKNNNANVSIVAQENRAEISNIVVEGKVFSAEDNVTIAPITQNYITGTTENNIAFIQINKDPANTTLVNINNNTNSEEIVLFRAYGNKVASANIVAIYLNAAESSFDSLSTNANAVIKASVANAPLTFNAEGKVVVNNFRQFWAWINICPWYEATNVVDFIGYEFELGN